MLGWGWWAAQAPLLPNIPCCSPKPYGAGEHHGYPYLMQGETCNVHIPGKSVQPVGAASARQDDDQNGLGGRSIEFDSVVWKFKPS